MESNIGTAGFIFSFALSMAAFLAAYGMIASMNNEMPLVWMNVTTSENWNRPAVGIVRVEQALCAELAKILGDRFRRCVWMDGEFVEFRPTDNNLQPDIRYAVDQLLPPTQTFDLARKFLSGRIAQFKQQHNNAGKKDGSKSLLAKIPISNPIRSKPMAGDILISIGLDWDQPYTDRFYDYRSYKGIKIITCCYDLIPVIFPQYCVGDVAARFKSYFNRLSWGSEAVLCISKQSESDLLDLWRITGSDPCRTQVIPLGDNIPGGDGKVSDEVERLTSDPFILFVSTIERRKNHEVLYRAYHLLSRSGNKEKLPKLVFVGMPGWGTGDLLSDLGLDPFTQDLIVQLHHVSDAELLQLYQRAMFCVYPSFYEGWGLPVGEALSLGKPVLASDQGSLPEVGGNLVRYVSPWDPREWADAILEWAESPEILAAEAKRVAENYLARTWSDTARVVAQLVNEMADHSWTELCFSPGYDFSSTVGLHCGPHLRSTGTAGFLMHGPYLGLQPGRYIVRIEGAILADSAKGKLKFEVTSAMGTVTNVEEKVPVGRTDFSDDSVNFLVQLPFALEHHVDDLEVRCIVKQGLLVELQSVRISSIKPEPALK